MLVELSGPTMFGRIGVMQALNRGRTQRSTWGPATAIVMHGQPVSRCQGVPRGQRALLGAAARSWGLQKKNWKQLSA